MGRLYMGIKAKRALAVIALLGVIAVQFGCTQGQTGGVLDPKNPVTVTLWHYYVGENQEAIEQAVSTFNQTQGLQKGVIVEAIAMGSIADLEAAVTDAAMGVINAQPMPDLFSSYSDKALEIDALDMLVDLNAYFTQEERALYVNDFLSDGILHEGKLLVLPIVKSTELLYLNATAWEEFALETQASLAALESWEEIYDTARAYYTWIDAKTPEIPWDGKGLIGIDSLANYIIIASKQLGLNVIDAAAEGGGAAVLDEAVLRRVFEVYYKGMCMGYFDAVGKFRSDDIKAEDLAAYVGSSSSAAYFPTWIERDNARFPIAFTALPYPTFEGGQPYAVQQGAGMCLAKTTQAEQEGAVLFLKWFTEPSQNIGFAMTTGYLPVQQAAYEAPAFTSVLETLRAGDDAKQNVASVYEIALQQITQSNTYAATPFTGSYKVRSVLQATLRAIVEQDEAKAGPLKAKGMSEQEILAVLHIEARFQDWLQAVRSELADAGIAYSG